MSREAKIREAHRLRDKGMSHRAIGERLGVAQGTITKWMDPERARRWAHNSNHRPGRRAQKTEWERNARVPCPSCGELFWGQKGHDRCWACWVKTEAERTQREHHQPIVEMWGAGVTLREIAAELGWSVNHLGVEMVRMRQKGYDLPYRYNVENGKRVPGSAA